jgi:hypothetical protein
VIRCCIAGDDNDVESKPTYGPKYESMQISAILQPYVAEKFSDPGSSENIGNYGECMYYLTKHRYVLFNQT